MASGRGDGTALQVTEGMFYHLNHFFVAPVPASSPFFRIAIAKKHVANGAGHFFQIGYGYAISPCISAISFLQC